MALKISVRYTILSREEFARSKAKGSESLSKIRLEILLGNKSHLVGEFSAGELRLLLGSEHAHFTWIRTAIKPESQVRDVDLDGADLSNVMKEYGSSDGIEFGKFRTWVQKFENASSIAEWFNVEIPE